MRFVQVETYARTAVAVDLAILGRFRALIESVEDSIAVAVLGTAALVDGRTRRRNGALVDTVHHAVIVAVVRASWVITVGGVDDGAGRRVGAAVEPVQNRIAVGIDRAAFVIHDGAARRVRAIVRAVGDSVAVAVKRAAFFVDWPAALRVGALVDPLEHTVLVEIPRAAIMLVDEGALWRVGTAIVQVQDAVAIGIFRRTAPEDPGDSDIEALVVKAFAAGVLGLELGAERHVRAEAVSDAAADAEDHIILEACVAGSQIGIGGDLERSQTGDEIRFEAAPLVPRIDQEAQRIGVVAECTIRVAVEHGHGAANQRAVGALQPVVVDAQPLKLDGEDRSEVPAQAGAVLCRVGKGQLTGHERRAAEKVDLDAVLTLLGEGRGRGENRDEGSGDECDESAGGA